MNKPSGMSEGVQYKRALEARADALENWIADSAMEHHQDVTEWSASVDLEAGTVTISDGAGNFEETYRFAFTCEGRLEFWPEGYDAPESVTDVHPESEQSVPLPEAGWRTAMAPSWRRAIKERAAQSAPTT